MITQEQAHDFFLSREIRRREEAIKALEEGDFSKLKKEEYRSYVNVNTNVTVVKSILIDDVIEELSSIKVSPNEPKPKVTGGLIDGQFKVLVKRESYSVESSDKCNSVTKFYTKAFVGLSKLKPESKLFTQLKKEIEQWISKSSSNSARRT